MPDSNYANVALLLHCDGSDGSTTFTDNSSSPKTVTAGGNAQISTAQSKFGGASALFDGSGDYLTLDGSADFAFGTGDFTIEFWLRQTSNSNIRSLYDSRPTSTDGHYVRIFAYYGSLIVVDNSVNIFDSVGAITLNTWTHVALCRSGTSLRLFVDGTQVGTTLTNSTSWLNGTNRPCFGMDGTTLTDGPLVGNLDDIRVTKGVARYTSNFTPHTVAHPDSGPVLLIPIIGNLTLTGQTPAIAIGNAVMPGIGQLAITGFIPRLKSPPDIGNLALTGQTLAIAIGNAITPAIGSAQVIGAIPALAHGWSAVPLMGETDIIGLQPKHSNFTFLGIPSAGQIEFDGLQPGEWLGFDIDPDGDYAPRASYVFSIAEQWISTHYSCRLSGWQDGRKKLILPISSFQIRRQATPIYSAYLSIIIPGIDSYIDAINARPNGRLQINRIYNYQDGSFSSHRMVNIPFDALSTNQGGKSGITGILSGSEEKPISTPRTFKLFDPITRSSDNGGIRYRCRTDPRLRPYDTVIINGETFVIESLLHIVDIKTAIMEVKEKL